MEIKLYSIESAQIFIDSKKREISSKIESENEDYILIVGEKQYSEFLASEFYFDFPVFHFDKAVVDSYEAEIPGSNFPSGFFVEPNKYYKKDIIVYEVPYTGRIHLLELRPSQYTLGFKLTIEVNTTTNVISIKIINFTGKPEDITREYSDVQRYMMSEYTYLKNDIDNYNNNLESYVRDQLTSRKQKILNKKSILKSLGVPLKKSNSTPQTFSVPSPKLREKIQIKPRVIAQGFEPEPTLDIHNYNSILKIINDVCKNFERRPSIYFDKEEEHLRDHILMVLDPNFEDGSASGETFNFKGKTDILLSYKGSVVFISECKFWTGIKGFMKTVDQLLGYLTWRDSKTSIVIFVTNKDFSNVLKEVKKGIEGHNNFVSHQPDLGESWFNYIFNLPNDPNKEIRLAIQFFHLPH
jgi:hypothetical protein